MRALHGAFRVALQPNAITPAEQKSADATPRYTIIGYCYSGAGRRPPAAAPHHHDVGMLAAMLIAILLVPVTFYVVERFADRRGERAAQDAVRAGANEWKR